MPRRAPAPGPHLACALSGPASKKASLGLPFFAPPGWLLAFVSLFPDQSGNLRTHWQRAHSQTEREAIEDEEIQPAAST